MGLTKYTFAKHAIAWVVCLLLFSATTVYGQITLELRHKKYTKISRKIHFHPSFHSLSIHTRDTVIHFTTDIPAISNDLLIKPTRQNFINDTVTLPLENIRHIKKGKDYVESMGYMALLLSLGSYVAESDEPYVKGAVPFSVAMAAVSASLITVGSIKTNYNMKRWKLVAIHGSNYLPVTDE
jgi:hypothetical protein